MFSADAAVCSAQNTAAAALARHAGGLDDDFHHIEPRACRLAAYSAAIDANLGYLYLRAVRAGRGFDGDGYGGCLRWSYDSHAGNLEYLQSKQKVE